MEPIIIGIYSTINSGQIKDKEGEPRVNMHKCGWGSFTKKLLKILNGMNGTFPIFNDVMKLTFRGDTENGSWN
jgi:hypothetical protein